MKLLDIDVLRNLDYLVVAKVKKVGTKNKVPLFALDSHFAPCSADEADAYFDEPEECYDFVKGQLAPIDNDFMEPDEWPQVLGAEQFLHHKATDSYWLLFDANAREFAMARHMVSYLKNLKSLEDLDFRIGY